jgi:hypothetical protein
MLCTKLISLYDVISRLPFRKFIIRTFDREPCFDGDAVNISFSFLISKILFREFFFCIDDVDWILIVGKVSPRFLYLFGTKLRKKYWSTSNPFSNVIVFETPNNIFIRGRNCFVIESYCIVTNKFYTLCPNPAQPSLSFAKPSKGPSLNGVTAPGGRGYKEEIGIDYVSDFVPNKCI